MDTLYCHKCQSTRLLEIKDSDRPAPTTSSRDRHVSEAFAAEFRSKGNVSSRRASTGSHNVQIEEEKTNVAPTVIPEQTRSREEKRPEKEVQSSVRSVSVQTSDLGMSGLKVSDDKVTSAVCVSETSTSKQRVQQPVLANEFSLLQKALNQRTRTRDLNFTSSRF